MSDAARVPVEEEFDPHTPMAEQNIRLAVALAVIDKASTSDALHETALLTAAVLSLSDAVINGRAEAASPFPGVTV